MRARAAAALAAIAALATACSLLIGTGTKILADGGEVDAADDAPSGPDGAEEAAPPDAAPPDGGCNIAGCLVEAGVCGTSCGVDYANCIALCKNQTCKDSCTTTETACRNACTANCAACTLGAGCEDQAACADASAM
jgi:hypothetical protein